MPRFRNMRERVEFAYDQLNVDIYYEGNYIYTLLDHSCDRFIEMLTEEELDYELEKIHMNKVMSNSVTGSRV